MLRLRPFKMSDAKYMMNWLKEERSFNMWSADKFTFPLTMEQLEGYKEMYEADEHGWIFVALDKKGIPVGHFLMRLADYEKESVHLGFIVVDPEIRGMGYGKEMVELAVKYAFQILKVKRVTLGVFDTNPAAKACYRRAGFEVETHHEAVFTYGEEKWGLYDMAIERP